jgi:hypothetical protein
MKKSRNSSSKHSRNSTKMDLANSKNQNSSRHGDSWDLQEKTLKSRERSMMLTSTEAEPLIAGNSAMPFATLERPNFP